MDIINKITGDILLPSSGNPPKALLVLLHGYGGNGHRLFLPLSQLRTEFPDLAIAIPDGPVLLDKGAHAWIRLSFPIDEEELWKGAGKAGLELRNYIITTLDAVGLKEDQLILLGFSQGAIMAMHLGLRMNNTAMAVIALSGFLVGEEHLGSLTSRPPVYLINGDMDKIVLPGKVNTTKEALNKAGINVYHTLINGLGHSIDKAVVKKIGSIIDRVIRTKAI